MILVPMLAGLRESLLLEDPPLQLLVVLDKICGDGGKFDQTQGNAVFEQPGGRRRIRVEDIVEG